MRDGHAELFATGDFSGNGIGLAWDGDQIFAGRACVIDHLDDALLGVGDGEPFGFDVAHGAQRLQLVGVSGAVLLVLGERAAVLRVGLRLGQAIRSRSEHIAIDQGDFEGILQVVDLGGDALQCSSVIAHGGVAVWGVKDIVQGVVNSIRIRTSRSPPVWRGFKLISQVALYWKVEPIGRYILVDQAMLDQFIKKPISEKSTVFNDVVTLKNDIAGRHMPRLHAVKKEIRSVVCRIYHSNAARPWGFSESVLDQGIA